MPSAAVVAQVINTINDFMSGKPSSALVPLAYASFCINSIKSSLNLHDI